MSHQSSSAGYAMRNFLILFGTMAASIVLNVVLVGYIIFVV